MRSRASGLLSIAIFRRLAASVDQVNRFVRQLAVADVAMRQRGCGNDGTVLNAHTVMNFIPFFQPRKIEIVSSTVGSSTKRAGSGVPMRRLFQYVCGIRRASLRRRCAVRPCANIGEHVAGVHRPSAAPAPTIVCSSSINRMMRPSLSLISVENCFEPLFKFTAKLGPSDKTGEIEANKSLFFILRVRRRWQCAAPDLRRWPFCQRRLHRSAPVVLGAAADHLDDAADFFISADNGIELAESRQLSQVAPVFLQRFVRSIRDSGW